MIVGGAKYIIVMFIAVLLSLAGGLVPVSTASADNLSVVNVSAPPNIPLGGSFVARISVTGNATFNSYQVQLNYDPSVIQVAGTEGGTGGVTQGLVGTTAVPIDMWSFYPPGKPGGAIRILGRIAANQSSISSGYLAEIHFNVTGSVSQNSTIAPAEITGFSNGLFDSNGTKLATVVPWGSASVQVYLPLQINTTSLSAASVENSYSVNLAAAGGFSPYTWNASGLPPGMTVSGAGAISGTPTQSGDFNVNLSITDSASPPVEVHRALILHVYPALQISSSSLPDATQGSSYSAAINTSAAAPPFSWSATGLPGGMNITDSGIINGSPIVSGDYNINVTATDSFNPPHSVAKTLTIHIYAGLAISTDLLLPGLIGSAYNSIMTASGGKTPYTWTAAGLPPGLNMSPAGSISGTPTSAGDFNITAYISDAFIPANTASRLLTLHVDLPLQITTVSLHEGVAGKSYSAALAASGGSVPYIWSSSGLPSGLTCSAAGAIGGIAAAPGDSVVSVTLVDSFVPANIRQATFNLHINDALIITITQLPEGLIGAAYSSNLTASGSRPNYTWTVNGLPAGLTLSADGRISGTASVAGSFNLNVSVTDSLSPPNTTAGTVTLKIYLVGDANGDGIVNMGDVTYVERVILGLSRATPGCDANLDGLITMGDVTRIERIILGLY